MLSFEIYVARAILELDCTFSDGSILINATLLIINNRCREIFKFSYITLSIKLQRKLYKTLSLFWFCQQLRTGARNLVFITYLEPLYTQGRRAITRAATLEQVGSFACRSDALCVATNIPQKYHRTLQITNAHHLARLINFMTNNFLSVSERWLLMKSRRLLSHAIRSFRLALWTFYWLIN